MQLQPGALEVDQVLEVEIAVGPIPELFLQARNAFVQVVDLTLLSVSGGIVHTCGIGPDPRSLTQVVFRHRSKTGLQRFVPL
jgi:hypothetical protein